MPSLLPPTLVAATQHMEFAVEPLHSNVRFVLVGMFAALLVGTIVRTLALRRATDEVRHDRIGSLESWWVIAVLVSTALVLGRSGVVLLLTLVSLVGFREFVRITPAGNADRATLRLSSAMILLSGLWLWLGHWDLFVVWLPLTSVLVPAGSLALRGHTQGFANTAASLCWGLLLIAWCPAHAASFYLLPAEALPPAGAAGLLVYLLLLTEWNDITQALVGRRFGRRHITPVVSPNKTLEGLLGGVLSTTLLAVLLAGWLTPFGSGPTLQVGQGSVTLPHLWSIIAGLLISLGGFLGDIAMSAVKRDAGVKDSGTLLPGQGGMLDRIDSLAFTAPLLAYYTRCIVLGEIVD